MKSDPNQQKMTRGPKISWERSEGRRKLSAEQSNVFSTHLVRRRPSINGREGELTQRPPTQPCACWGDRRQTVLSHLPASQFFWNWQRCQCSSDGDTTLGSPTRQTATHTLGCSEVQGQRNSEGAPGNWWWPQTQSMKWAKSGASANFTD